MGVAVSAGDSAVSLRGSSIDMADDECAPPMGVGQLSKLGCGEKRYCGEAITSDVGDWYGRPWLKRVVVDVFAEMPLVVSVSKVDDAAIDDLAIDEGAIDDTAE